MALLVMGMWIEYEELYCTYGGPFAENSPPNSAIGVIWILLAISAILYKLRRPLRLVAAELVVIYTALVLAAPLMTQGMWHRIFGLLAGITHHGDFKSYESLPPMLWPHGPNLVLNGQFRQGLDGFQHVGGGTLTWEEIDRQAKGIWRSPVLSNGDDPEARATLAFSLARHDDRGRETLVPGENFLFSCLVKAEGIAKGSSYFVQMQADDGPAVPLLVGAEATKPSFALPEGFRRIGACPVAVPVDLQDRLTLRIGLNGPGRLTLQDVQFLNVEAIEGAYSGVQVAREGNLDQLSENERNFTVVRPDKLLSARGLLYLLRGFIPLGQWVRPALAWGLLVSALFLGFLGLNTLMRKQWVENERFTFPLTILPKRLFEEHETEAGKVVLSLFRNRVMWIGFAVTLPLVLLKGTHFYFPGIPAPVTSGVIFANYVTSPLLKAFLGQVGIGITTGINFSFCVLAIAFLIETDILLSLWAAFLLFQLWPFFGRAFNFTRFPGYPWEFQQAMGGFIGFALLAVFVGRRHLGNVLRIALGRSGTDNQHDARQEIVSYRTAVLMVVGSLLLLVWWGVWTKMGAVASLLFFGYMLVCGFAASKIRAECGAPWAYLTPYFGMQFVAAVGGFAVFKSTGMLVATIASGFMCTALFLLIAPVQVEMMELGRHFGVRPRDIHAGLWLGLLGGLLIGGFVLLCWMYGFGASSLKTTWPYEQNWYFTSFRVGELNTDRAFESGTVGQVPETRPLNLLKNPDARGLSIGLVITLALAVLRAKFMWFPIHPLGYVLASSFFMKSVFYAVFIAWAVRALLFRIGGVQAIRRGLVPFCLGMFLACIASIMIFDMVGIYMRLHGIVDVYAGIP